MSFETTKFRLKSYLTYKNKRKKPFFDHLKVEIVLIIIVYFNVIFLPKNGSSLNVVSIVPFSHSSLDSSKLRVMQNMIPANFFSLSEFTVVFEYTIIFSSELDQNKFIQFFTFGTTGFVNFIKTEWNNPVMNFYRDPINIPFIIPEVNTKRFEGKVQHTFTFLVEYYLNNIVELHFVDFVKNDLNAEFGTPQKQFWSSQSFENIENTLFILNRSETSSYQTQIRRIYAIDRIFQNTDFEFLHMYKGIADLQYAIYFYMEPVYSKITLNRSKYN